MSVPLRAGVLVADDHALVRRGLRVILDSCPDLRVVAEVDNGHDALRDAQRPDVDLAMLDLAMPGLDGLEAARGLRASRPDLKILILSLHEGEQYVFEAVRAGACGFVVKSAADEQLVDACRRALRGERFVGPQGASKLVRTAIARARAGKDGGSPLTAREEELTRLIADGLSGQLIAERLGISAKTVERHRTNILAKLGVRDRVELTHYAIRQGLVDA